MKPILEVQHLSKGFYIGAQQEPYLALRDMLASPTKLLSKQKKEVFKALDDVSFNVMPGESIGIIGRNGAGKSTLLKILSKITPPSSGKIICRGRIAALLEVGTGFHAELTGRENIYMNGSILGMRKWEIDKHFDEIVDFSGVEKFLDTPLKRYSSGMQLRLAFAVAAHLEPEILIIDEVLAVGDAEFQKKCLGKMDEVTKSGRTVLFVSHNMAAVKQLCNKGILLKNGRLEKHDKVEEIIDLYNSQSLNSHDFICSKNKTTYFKNLEIFQTRNSKTIVSNQKTYFEFTIESSCELKNILIGIGINDKLGYRITTPFSEHLNIRYNLKKGLNTVQCTILNLNLKPDTYTLELYLGDESRVFDYNDFGNIMEVTDIDGTKLKKIPTITQGNVLMDQIWT